jgi:hypothetical protein
MTTNTNTAVELSPDQKAAVAKSEQKLKKLKNGFANFPEKRTAVIAILTATANDLAEEEGGDAGAEYLALLKVFRHHKDARPAEGGSARSWTDAERAAVSEHLKTRSPTDWTEADCQLAYHYLDILDTFLAGASPKTFDKYADDLMAIARALRGALSEKISERR